jgi:predicted RNA binding protein YcfA (HicA-like mRNA interferase family)
VSRWSPCRRSEFIRRLRKLGFAGPFSGTKHQFMVHRQHRLTVPSNNEYSVPQLRMMIREVETILERAVTVEAWNSLG